MLERLKSASAIEGGLLVRRGQSKVPFLRTGCQPLLLDCAKDVEAPTQGQGVSGVCPVRIGTDPARTTGLPDRHIALVVYDAVAKVPLHGMGSPCHIQSSAKPLVLQCSP